MTAKEAYALELEKMRAKIGQLRDQLDTLIGDGQLSDKIQWAHVGDLKRMNADIDAALATPLYRVP